ncbi:hypothetical protein V6N12_008523 [Hibiscus sabdariffa]|uniref:RNase H type-1 domain-containing protein n=1 Tax=Hibiscus sabdariffa TaxID=183260 RepID=A0ABR2BJP7_9ROSI
MMVEIAWCAPPVNVDGAFAADRGATIGIVARDPIRRVLGGLAQHGLRPTEAGLVKIVALIVGLHLACDRGRSRELFEIDSALLLTNWTVVPPLTFRLLAHIWPWLVQSWLIKVASASAG